MKKRTAAYFQLPKLQTEGGDLGGITEVSFAWVNRLSRAESQIANGRDWANREITVRPSKLIIYVE